MKGKGYLSLFCVSFFPLNLFFSFCFCFMHAAADKLGRDDSSTESERAVSTESSSRERDALLLAAAKVLK